jgi:hypothetical protein
MTNEPDREDGRLFRLTFRFHERENALLAQDLSRFQKGPKRNGRLMTLVTMGLMTERAMNSTASVAMPANQGPGAVPQSHPEESGLTAQDIDDLFNA